MLLTKPFYLLGPRLPCSRRYRAEKWRSVNHEPWVVSCFRPPIFEYRSLENMPPSSPPTIFTITESEIDLNDLLVRITLPTTGAAAIFTGMVRGLTSREEPHDTVYLEYEAYVPMAEAKMKQVADEIRARWPSVEGIAIVQRVGRLYPQTPTVLIACSAAHRDTGVFEAARYGIDRLKEIVPVWKKEVGPHGETWVEGDYVPTEIDLTQPHKNTG